MIAYIACLKRRAFYPCSMRAFGDEPLWARGGLMAKLLEIAGKETLSQLDYVGSLNIQWWATLRGMRAALPLVGNRHRWRAAVHQMQEIDALKVMAFEPVEFVLAPKYLAALVAVPCLSVVAAFFGILAGGLFMF